MRKSRHTAPAVWGQGDSQGRDTLKSPLVTGPIPAAITALTAEALLLGNLGLPLQARLLPGEQPIGVALTCPPGQSPLSWGQLLSGPLATTEPLSGSQPCLVKGPLCAPQTGH